MSDKNCSYTGQAPTVTVLSCPLLVSYLRIKGKLSHSAPREKCSMLSFESSLDHKLKNICLHTHSVFLWFCFWIEAKRETKDLKRVNFVLGIKTALLPLYIQLLMRANYTLDIFSWNVNSLV